MKYGLVACDFDGTLLRDDDTISAQTASVIREYERRGGVFMLATGRMHRSIIKRFADTGLTGNLPVASYQGAMIRESLTDKVLAYDPLCHEDALAVALEAESLGIYIQCYQYDTLVLARRYGSGSFGHSYAQKLGISDFETADTISGFIRAGRVDCSKLVIAIDPQKMRQTLQHFSQKFPQVTFNSSHAYMIEAINANTGKHKACDRICANLGIGIESCIAIGDSLNDLTMINHAGLGVAVANAMTEVKEQADVIAPSNNEDGVAWTLKEYCL